jgi:hypothetical protein
MDRLRGPVARSTKTRYFHRVLKASWHIARASLALTLATVALGGCATSSASRAAEVGDWATLRSAIGNAHKKGKLSEGDAVALARKVAVHEIKYATKETAVARVRDVHSCANELDGALADRMDIHDEAGAEAALARLDAGGFGAGSARAYLGDKDDAWRAVGTRGLTREKDRKARIIAMTDGSPRVRRAAVRAAAEAGADEDTGDKAEIEQLATTARVDPEGIVRTDAVRALAAIGGAEVVAKLRDLVTTPGLSDDGLRSDIGVAWAAPRIYKAGGAEPLRLLIASEHGPGAIEAAAAALRFPEVDGDIRASASALMARTIADGPRLDRLHAILLANVKDPLVLAALRAAGKIDAGGDREIEVAANARLTESVPDRAAAIRALETRAGQDLGRLSMRARWALAEAKDTRVQAWVENDLTAADPYARLSAGAALSALGRASRGAPLLADGDPLVRTRAACTLLLASRVRP